MRLNEKQVALYRAVSGDFEGLSVAEAAERFHLSPQAVNKQLRAIEAACPQLFPLVTKQEADVLALYERAGWPVAEIAEKIGVSESRVYSILQSLVKKGKLAPEGPVGKMLSYDKSMDAQIKEKF